MFKRFLKNQARRLGFEIIRLGDIDVLESLIYYVNNNDFFFVQIGANNGVRYDPIYKIVNELKLAGLVVEPVGEYFNELCKNYRQNPRVTPVNKAIYEENKMLTIYRVIEKSGLPDWSQGIASLNPQHYEQHKGAGINDSDILEEHVHAITFEELFGLYKVRRVDLLQIDTEGYDYNLLMLFPFDKFKPRIIHFEHGLPNKTMSIKQFSDIHKMLVDLGYQTIMKEYDMIAYFPKRI